MGSLVGPLPLPFLFGSDLKYGHWYRDGVYVYIYIYVCIDWTIKEEFQFVAHTKGPWL